MFNLFLGVMGLLACFSTRQDADIQTQPAQANQPACVTPATTADCPPCPPCPVCPPCEECP